MVYHLSLTTQNSILQYLLMLHFKIEWNDTTLNFRSVGIFVLDFQLTINFDMQEDSWALIRITTCQVFSKI